MEGFLLTSDSEENLGSQMSLKTYNRDKEITVSLWCIRIYRCLGHIIFAIVWAGGQECLGFKKNN